MQNKNFEKFIIYNTEKLNGENAQISFILNKFWVVGSKNKTLLVEKR
jgi:hypothetical protein